MNTTSEYARRAMEKAASGSVLTGNEQRRVAGLQLRINYRPLGASPGLLTDRIHSLQDPSGGGSSIATELHFRNSTVQIDIDANGAKVKNASGNYALLTPTGQVTVHNASNGKEVQINPNSISHDITIRTISVCSSGVTKSMDILASAPY